MAQQVDIPALTGLRGIAVLLVLYERYFIWCAPYSALTAPKFLLNTTGTSTFGMTLFFTLSGFVIVYNYRDFGLFAGGSQIAAFTGCCLANSLSTLPFAGSSRRLSDGAHIA